MKGTDGQEDGTWRCKRRDMAIQKFPEWYLKIAYLFFFAHQSFKDKCPQGQLVIIHLFACEKVVNHNFMINHESSVGGLIMII